MIKPITHVLSGVLVFMLGLFFLSQALAGEPSSQGYIAPYDGLLKQYVSHGQKFGIDVALVDYNGWSKDPRHTEALRQLEAVNPDTLTGRDAMAFWINAYNLLTIDLITRNKEIDSIKDLGGVFQNPWKSYQWTIGGQSYSLDDIEHQNLRKRGDPRVHMALVCASVSCPDLRNEAYTADHLDSQLDAQAQTFLDNQMKGLSETKDGYVLSPIFKWYASDFGGEDGVLKFIAKHHKPIVQNAVIYDYFNYNWQLNRL